MELSNYQALHHLFNSMNHESHIDRPFLLLILIISLCGFGIFISASLGLLTRNGPDMTGIALTQALSLLLGFAGFFIVSHIHYRFWRSYAFMGLLGAIGLNLILFIPGIGIEHGGAVRWIDIGITSFQPSEVLKIMYIVYCAGWLSSRKNSLESITRGLIPFLVILGIICTLLIAQSDTDTLVVIGATGITMLLAAGAKLRHIALICGFGLVVVSGIIIVRPYARDRILTYFDPSRDPSGSSYQIQQSLIAVGSGQMFGRGFGQSLQKFYYLPEPIGDSIFAVQAEEFGFVGSILLIGLYVALAWRSLKIAQKAPDAFGGLIIVGVVILIIVESFMNISSMIGLLPLSGQPLLFVSHGGTALAIILTSVGLIANISRHKKKVGNDIVVAEEIN